MEKDYNTITIPAWFAEFNEAPRHVKANHTREICAACSLIALFLGAASEPFWLSVIFALVAMILLGISYFA